MAYCPASVPSLTLMLFVKNVLTCVIREPFGVRALHRILELIKLYYLGPRHLFDTVVAFNENSKDFDFRSVLSVAKVST